MTMEKGPRSTGSHPTPVRLLLAWLGAIALLCSGSLLTAQTVEQHLWNFDNRVQPGRFNTLRILVHNPSGETLDTDLRIFRQAGGLRRGAPLRLRCFLSPRGRRWLTLQPFVASSDDSWELEWPDLKVLGTSLPHGGKGARAMVYLVREGDRARALANFPPFSRFPASLLPRRALGLLPLRAVVVDHALSDLDRRQRINLMRWVRAGGRVHVLPRDGELPEFEEELAALNNSAVGNHVLGAGQLRVHSRDAAALRKELPLDFDPEFLPAAGTGMFFTALDYMHQMVRAQGRDRIDPQRSWSLIILITLIYTVLVGPGFWWFSRRPIPWWTALMYLAGVVAASTWIFEQVGARASDEADSRNGRVLLQNLGRDQWAATEMSNLFATRPSDLRLRSPSKNQASFSSAQLAEAIRGEIVHGQETEYRLHMPAFSHRFVAHQSIVEEPSPRLELRGSGRQLELKIKAGPALKRLFVLQADEILVMQHSGNSWRCTSQHNLGRAMQDAEELLVPIDDAAEEADPDRGLMFQLLREYGEIEHRLYRNTDLQPKKLRMGRQHLLCVGIGPQPKKALLQGFAAPDGQPGAFYIFHAHRSRR